jgi:hypothetical protein
MPKEISTAQAWQKIFDSLDVKDKIERTGHFRLSANQIKSITAREPRLMTKFDSRKSRPKLLSDNDITILPTTNGEYSLFRGDGYFGLPGPQSPESYDASKIARLQTMQWNIGIRSEPQAIDTLFMVSALRTFVGDETLQLTIRGRLRCHKFAFRFKTAVREELVSVDGVQVEVDSGYEGKKIAIVEAKFGAVDSFIVRQLYYPYRDLLARGVTKPIVPILLVYSNRIYSLYSFKFDQDDSYQSISLVRQVDYSLEDLKTPPRLADFVTAGRKKPPAEIPFPQADDLSKVFDLCDFLSYGPADKDEIGEKFQLDPRQGDYYGNAASWLGLAEKRNSNFCLTSAGVRFNTLNRTDRLAEIAATLSELSAFAEAIAARTTRQELQNDEIAKLIARHYGLTGTTPTRRALTVQSWVDYLASNLR